jgi:DNA-binding response OmpR family regulator
MGSSSRKVVLIIEDHPAIRHLMSIVLDRPDTHLVFANDGLSGLEAIHAHAPDVVVLDLLLPDIMGWEVLEHIRVRHSGSELPVLVVTAYGGDGDDCRAFELGANGYLPKPFEPESLRQAVCALLGGAVLV